MVPYEVCALKVTLSDLIPRSAPVVDRFYRNFWNEFDELGNLISLPRIPGEKNWAYKRRIYDVFVNIANSSYRGMVNGITRELGLAPYKSIDINPKVGTNGDFIAPYPYIEFDGSYLNLYSDYASETLEYQIDRYEPGGNYEHIGRLVDFINSSTYFTASIKSGIDNFTRSMTILNQSNKETVIFEKIPNSNKFALKNRHLAPGTVFFSNRSVFRTEVGAEISVDAPGKYYVNYSKGYVTVYTIPTIDEFVRYQYLKYPFSAISSPVILHDINDDNFKIKLFEQILQDNGTYAHGLPSSLGVDIINEILSVKPMYWGV